MVRTGTLAPECCDRLLKVIFLYNSIISLLSLRYQSAILVYKLVLVIRVRVFRDVFSGEPLAAHLSDVHFAVVLFGDFFQSHPLGFGDDDRGEDTEQHEQSEDFHHVVQPTVLVVRGTAVVDKSTNTGLSDDGTNLTRGGRQTVSRRPVSGREDFTGDNESGGVGAEVLEELGDNVQPKLTTFGQAVVTETDTTEKRSQNDETTDLNRLSADGVNGGGRHPVTRKRTSTHKNQVTGGGVVQPLVDVLLRRVTDGQQNNGSVQTNTVVSDIQEEPRETGTDQDLSVLPGTEVSHEVLERGLRGSDLLGFNVDGAFSVGHLVQVGGFIDVERVTGGFGDGQTVVKSNTTGDTTETNEDTPHLVTGLLTLGVAHGGVVGVVELVLVTGDTDDGDDTGEDLAQPLVGEHGGHDGTSPSGGGEFRRDNRRKRVVTANTDTHDDSQRGQDGGETDGRRRTQATLDDGGTDHHDQFQPVDGLTTQDVGGATETDLTNDSTDRGGNLQKGFRRRGQLTPPEGVVHHGDGLPDGEDIVGVGHEPDPGDHDHLDLSPPEAGVVDFLQRQSLSFQGVLDVLELTHIVLERGFTTTGVFVVGLGLRDLVLGHEEMSWLRKVLQRW